MPPIRKQKDKDKPPSDQDKGLGYLEGKVSERVQPVVKALNEMRPIFVENTKAIRELTKAIRDRR